MNGTQKWVPAANDCLWWAVGPDPEHVLIVISQRQLGSYNVKGEFH